ncbi:zinc ribbon domain-containing protein [bacterium]|nr:zinc ribbon domain-containing protein [bacterium]
MPTYDYECKNCQHAFEEFHSMSAKPVKKCPECGGKVIRLIGSGAGIIFKGSGFYETDYKKNDSVQTSQPKKEEKAPEKKSEKGKTESKKKVN